VIAFGVVCHAATASDSQRSSERAELWLRSRSEGFTLAEVYDLDAGTRRSTDVLQHVAEAAARTEIITILLAGSGDRTAVTALARRNGLCVVHLHTGHNTYSEARS
jgi:hypothetical protein